jgi:vancomycin resistance protein YoaR
MPWYGWLIIGVLVALVVMLIVFLIRKKPAVVGFTQEEKDALAKAAAKQAQQELDIERSKNVKLEALAKAQKDKLRKLELWYEDAKGKIDAQRQKDFEALTASDDALLAELDKQLGLSEDTRDDTEETRPE